MIRAFASFINKNKLFSVTDRVLLAVSGGIDSVVMADLFHRSELDFGIAHCNFSLRGRESDADEDFTRNLAANYKVPFFVRKFDTSGYASMHKISIQMAARELRYAWFEEIRSSEKFDFISTAHHLDDQIETFLINMIRGTGISGLHGILPKQRFIIRPMLFAGRKEIASFASKYNISYREDSSNKEDKYIRNNLRQHIIPLLKEINPNFRKTLTTEISILRGWEQLGIVELEKNMKKVCKCQPGKTTIDLKVMKGLSPPELYAWEILSTFNFNPEVVSAILSIPERKSGKVFLSPTHRAVKDRETIIVQPLKRKPVIPGRRISAKIKSIRKPLRLTFSVSDYTNDSNIPIGKEFASLDFHKLSFPLEIRKWKPGDRFQPFGLKGRKKVSDLLINEKISLPDKENTYVLCSSGKIAWVIGHRIDQNFRITSKTKKIYSLQALFG
ncbi:MAG: tRNA lysidine(34) synthetase TilS [Bacteroidetes bacterium]|nr:tRNA lysidine(34) synthetase TilS [Bacteroidota bacterium]